MSPQVLNPKKKGKKKKKYQNSGTVSGNGLKHKYYTVCQNTCENITVEITIYYDILYDVNQRSKNSCPILLLRKTLRLCYLACQVLSLLQYVNELCQRAMTMKNILLAGQLTSRLATQLVIGHISQFMLYFGKSFLIFVFGNQYVLVISNFLMHL